MNIKIKWNLIVSFIIFPCFFLYKAIYNYISDPGVNQINIFSFIQNYIFGFFLSLILLFTIFYPFQYIKDRKQRSGNSYSFVSKWLILSLLFTIVIFGIGLSANAWFLPIWKNLGYILAGLSLGLLFSTILYFTVDRYVEKPKKN